MKFCPECGAPLQLRALEGEGQVPWCPGCQAWRFPTFSTAIIAAVLSPDRERVLLIQQYGRPNYILLAGYVSKGESAEQTLLREVREETGLTVTEYRYMRSAYFARSNTLMLNFWCVAGSDSLAGLTREVDKADWFSFAQAREQILHGSLAERFLTAILDELEGKPSASEWEGSVPAAAL